jgi:predicted RNase H-like nuclease (RuvC/YqgF family)
MQDEKIRVSLRIPNSILETVRQFGYKSMTDAILEGLQLLIQSKECKTIADECRHEDAHEFRFRLEEKDKQIDEKDRHIDTLKRELDKANQDKDDLKKTFDNYMVQVQTLITQKSIEAPGSKKPWWRFW